MSEGPANPFAFGELLRQTAHRCASWVEALPDRPVGAAATREELLQNLGGPLNDQPLDPSKVAADFFEAAEGGLVASPGPRYFGFVTGGAVPASLAADWMASAWDQNGVLSFSSPAAAVTEEIIEKWVVDLLGLPAGTSMGLVTGCQMANFTCLAAARHEVLRRGGWDMEKKGLAKAPPITVIAGEEAHATLVVALRMLGFGADEIILVPTDGQGRMTSALAEEALKTTSGPAILCLQAGNVNTGAFDPCDEIIPLARDRGAWVHVDGAFGLWGKLLPTLDDHTAGIELADSWATDGHKWLNVPYDSGLALVRNSAAHRASMALNAPYYIPAEGEARDPSQWVPESSRRSRGFPLYCGLKSLGKKGLAEVVERNCRQARLMATLLAEDPAIGILNDVVLNQVLVRFSPSGTDGDDFTRLVTAKVQEEGTCWAGGSFWKGMAVMRISVSNWATSDDDINKSAAAIRAVVAKAAAEL